MNIDSIVFDTCRRLALGGPFRRGRRILAAVAV